VTSVDGVGCRDGDVRREMNTAGKVSIEAFGNDRSRTSRPPVIVAIYGLLVDHTSGQ
jgi:hypothetical protein